MKKFKLIIIICVVIGFMFIIGGLLLKWKVTFNNNFFCWIGSPEGLTHLADMVGSLGISLLSATIFLVGVEWIIEKSKIKENFDKSILIQRKIIAREMRENPKVCYDKLRSSTENREALLNGQFFAGCNFSGIDFDGEDFSGTNFLGADFSNSSFIGTSFRSCNMNDVKFINSKLTHADFTGATLDIKKLKLANSLWMAILPDGNLYDGSFDLKGDIEIAKDKGYDLANTEQRKEFFESN